MTYGLLYNRVSAPKTESYLKIELRSLAGDSRFMFHDAARRHPRQDFQLRLPASEPSYYSAGAGARKIRSLILSKMRSYKSLPFSAVDSVGRPIEPALPLGTVSHPRL
jgi:hypothetical protein